MFSKIVDKVFNAVFIIAVILLILDILLNFKLCGNPMPSPEVRIDTLYHTDTVKIDSPVVKHEKVVRWKTKVLTDTVHDTIPQPYVSGDSLFVPISQKEYSDDTTYRAWVSGYDVRLDSIRTYMRTMVVNKEIITKEKQTRFRWGLQGGIGYGIFNKSPDLYVGFGGSWSF